MENVISFFCLFICFSLWLPFSLRSAICYVYYDTTHPHNEIDRGHRMMEYNNIEKQNFNIKINGHIHTHKCNL